MPTPSSGADLRPTPIDGAAFVKRVRLTAWSGAYMLLGVPALVLAILSILTVPLGVVIVGFVLASVVVPVTASLTGLHRRISGAFLGETITARYADTTGTNVVTRPLRWLRDTARWRDVGFLWFSGTGGLALSAIPLLLLAAPITHLVFALVDGGWVWWLLVTLAGPLWLVWWLITPALVTTRARAERAILGASRVSELEQRVEHVAEARRDALDHRAAEVRRIERDLHDGTQARMVAVGMNVGLAEKLLRTDPDTASMLLREARETNTAALDDLRTVVRGIHPPVLADRGLLGAIEALAVQLPVPVTVAVHLDRPLSDPVQSALYFAVAELLANTIKHAHPTRAWVTGQELDGAVRLVVGDDGHGGADPTGQGLSGVRRRLAAFDGTLDISSPAGGPTIATIGVPWGTPR